jgi:hypothetical protein
VRGLRRRPAIFSGRPEGRADFNRLLRRSSITMRQHRSLLSPCIRSKSVPSWCADVVEYGSNSRDDGAHFAAANEALGNALRVDPNLGQRLGLTNAQIRHITRQPPSELSPPGLTWQHHQDAGRMQLVNALEHNAFPGGHAGGMRLWGGGRN